MKKQLWVMLVWMMILVLLLSGCGKAALSSETESSGEDNTQSEALLAENTEQIETSSSGAGAKCGDNLTWEYDENTKTLRISGTGPMYDYEEGSSTPWSEIIWDIETVEISSGVTTVGDGAFNTCKASSVTLPDTLTSIGDKAFYYCGALPNITIPDGVTHIGSEAFCSTSFSEVVIPSSMREIGEYAFYGCDYLSTVTISGTDLSIGNAAFKECYKVGTLVLEDGIVSIGEEAFESCAAMTELTIPDSVTEIGEFAFSLCRDLKKVTIGSGIVDLNGYVFSNDYELETLVIPATVKSIGVKAFMDDPLKEIYYGGAEEDWKAIEIDNSGSYNNGLYAAQVYYHSR